MKMMYEIDKEGFVVGTQFVSSDTQETEYLKEGWSEPYIKAQWNFHLNRWMEGASDEELNPPKPEPTETEKLRIEVDELKVKNTKLEKAQDETQKTLETLIKDVEQLKKDKGEAV